MAIDTNDPDYIESLMPTPEEEYDEAVDATFARRLGLMLVKNGTLSEYEAVELLYPSWEQIKEAQRGR
jgi:hypothetical protein